ncbi:MAG: PKD domain-containing protein, partial [Candidatus Thermoplasmatota archaeon]
WSWYLYNNDTVTIAMNISNYTESFEYTYDTAGTYTASLYVSNTSSGLSSWLIRSDYITVSGATANFTSNVTSGIAPLVVQFNDTSSGEPSSWYWDFGDGDTSIDPNLQNPVHTYDTGGTYTVRLYTNGVWENKTNYITVTNASAPVASFTSNVTSGTVSFVVQFNDTSTVTADMYGYSDYIWCWYFEDDNTWTNRTAVGALSRNVTHEYTIQGAWDVKLLVVNASGSDWENKTDYITALVSGGSAPIADFSANILAGEAPLVVTFTDSSTGSYIDTWSWAFSDGQTSSEQNPVMTFDEPGESITVILNVSGIYGWDNKTEVAYITTYPFTADFTATPLYGDDPLTVTFTDASSNDTPTAWYWDFGDGVGDAVGDMHIGSYSQNPTHVYSTPGTYTIKLRTTNDSVNYMFRNRTSYVTVVDAETIMNPVAAFSANATSGPTPLAIFFTDASNCYQCQMWNWSFGDGSWFNTTSAALANPTHQYTLPGAYTVRLLVTNATGFDWENKTHYITTTTSTGIVSSYDVCNGTYTKYWMSDICEEGNFSTYGFVYSLTAPLMSVFSYWIFLIIWLTYLAMVWIRTGDVTLPLVIGIISSAVWSYLFPAEALTAIGSMFAICFAVIFVRIMKDAY